MSQQLKTESLPSQECWHHHYDMPKIKTN